MSTRRRSLLLAGAGSSLGVALRTALGAAVGTLAVRPAQASTDSMRAAVARLTGGARVGSAPGRVLIDIAPLVENGNTVPVTVTVSSPMTAAEHVKRIAIFNELNPNPEVAVFQLGPRNGRAVVGTRIRLATSQQVLALAEMSDGSWWQQAVDVVVTLAACIE
jgi:sulfur-oxidizing protein SoxY